MVCLIKHFPQEWKEGSACGMLQLITNSESPFSLRLLSFFLLVAALPSVMACFVVSAQGGSSEETARESSLGIFQSHSDPRVSVSSSQITLCLERLSLFCYLSLYCQKSTKTWAPACFHSAPWNVSTIQSVLCWYAFTGCKSAYCIFKIPHFLENVAFEDENLILTEAHYKKDKIKKRDEREKAGGEREQRKWAADRE